MSASLVVIRNDQYIARRRRLGIILSLVGILTLIAGLILSLVGDPATAGLIAWASLPFGFIFSQIGLYFSHRYVRSPRPDERLDEGLRKVAKQCHLYHYVLPVSHVLLTPAGPIVIVAKYQAGDITVEGDKWTQKGLGLRRFFGQEGIGNPTAEATYQIKQLAKYISHHAPQLAEKELPMSAIIVLTAKDGGTLKVNRPTIPTVHYTKLKGFWRQRKQDRRLEQEDYEALRQAFDAALR